MESMDVYNYINNSKGEDIFAELSKNGEWSVLGFEEMNEFCTYKIMYVIYKIVRNSERFETISQRERQELLKSLELRSRVLENFILTYCIGETVFLDSNSVRKIDKTVCAIVAYTVKLTANLQIFLDLIKNIDFPILYSKQ